MQRSLFSNDFERCSFQANVPNQSLSMEVEAPPTFMDLVGALVDDGYDGSTLETWVWNGLHCTFTWKNTRYTWTWNGSEWLRDD